MRELALNQRLTSIIILYKPEDLGHKDIIESTEAGTALMVASRGTQWIQ